MNDSSTPKGKEKKKPSQNKKGSSETLNIQSNENLFDEAHQDHLENQDAELTKTEKQITQKKALSKKKIKKRAMYGAAALLVFFIIQWLFTPFQGGMKYGICKTFLELTVAYPQTIELSTVDENLKENTSVRIWFTHIDPFGEYRLEPIECIFRPDPQIGAALDKVFIGKIAVDKAKIEAFNVSIPGLLSHPPNLDLPTELPDSLGNLQIDPMSLRPKFF